MFPFVAVIIEDVSESESESLKTSTSMNNVHQWLFLNSTFMQ